LEDKTLFIDVRLWWTSWLPITFLQLYLLFFIAPGFDISRNSRKREKILILALLINAKGEFRDYVSFMPIPLKEDEKLKQFLTRIKK
jgi:hypothetical protein